MVDFVWIPKKGFPTISFVIDPEMEIDGENKIVLFDLNRKDEIESYFSVLKSTSHDTMFFGDMEDEETKSFLKSLPDVITDVLRQVPELLPAQL